MISVRAGRDEAWVGTYQTGLEIMANAVGATEPAAAAGGGIWSRRQLQILIRCRWLRSGDLSLERLQFGGRYILIHDRRFLCTLGHFGTRRLQWPEHGAEYNAIEHHAANDEHCAAPAIALDQQLRQRGKDKGAKTGAAYGNARGQRAARLEVLRDADNGRQIDEPEAQASAEANGHYQRGHILGKHAANYAAGRQNGARNGHRSTAIAIHKRRADGTWFGCSQ